MIRPLHTRSVCSKNYQPKSFNDVHQPFPPASLFHSIFYVIITSEHALFPPHQHLQSVVRQSLQITSRQLTNVVHSHSSIATNLPPSHLSLHSHFNETSSTRSNVPYLKMLTIHTHILHLRHPHGQCKEYPR